MPPGNENDLNIFRATTMLLSGSPDKPVDALLFHSRSAGDDRGLFELAGRFYRQKLVDKVVISNTEGERYGSDVPFEASPGKTEYAKRLREQRVLRRDILYPEDRAYHTRQENDAFVRLSANKGWTSAAILAQPHQIVRATLGMVQAMQRLSYIMEVYTVSPATTQWQEVATGSQGLNPKPREEHIQGEFERIYRYQEKGELASFEDLFTYLRQRDTGTLRLGAYQTATKHQRAVEFSGPTPAVL